MSRDIALYRFALLCFASMLVVCTMSANKHNNYQSGTPRAFAVRIFYIENTAIQ